MAEEQVQPGCGDTGTVSLWHQGTGHSPANPLSQFTQGANRGPWQPLLHHYAEAETRWWENVVWQSLKKKKKLKTPSFLMLWSFVLTNLDIGQRLSEHEIVDAKLHRSLCKFTLNEIFLTSYNYKWFVLIWKILCSL